MRAKSNRLRLISVMAVVSLAAIACQTGPTGPGPTVPPQPVDTVEVGGQTVTVTVPPTLTVDVESADLSGLPEIPEGSISPVGALDIKVSGLPSPGAAVTLTIQLERPADDVRKLVGGVWDEFAPDGTTGVTLSTDGLTITLQLVDGGRGDNDGLANRVIVDPVLPLEDAEVEIHTSRTPVMALGSPYELQLDATGPDPDAINWSVLQGALPPGLTLDPSGLVSGTPAAPFGIARVEATDGTLTDTKLLFFMAQGPTSSIVPTGAPLPEGTELMLYEPPTPPGPGSPPKLSRFSATGDVEPLSMIGISDLNSLFVGTSGSFVDPSGSRIAFNLAGTPGRVDILDADTGELLVNIADDPTFENSGTEFSANGSYLLVKGGSGRIYDTTTGDLVRELIDGFPTWASDDELISSSFGGSSGPVDFRHATDPGLDRWVNTPEGCGASPVAISLATNRMALTCPYKIVTVSMLDGTDARDVTSACGVDCAINQMIRFSPTGSHLVFATGDYATHSVVFAPDEPGASITALTEPGPVYPLNWN